MINQRVVLFDVNEPKTFVSQPRETIVENYFSRSIFQKPKSLENFPSISRLFHFRLSHLCQTTANPSTLLRVSRPSYSLSRRLPLIYLLLAQVLTYQTLKSVLYLLKKSCAMMCLRGRKWMRWVDEARKYNEDSVHFGVGSQ